MSERSLVTCHPGDYKMQKLPSHLFYIGYLEAPDQAAGTGTAVITKTITLHIPYEVK